MKHITTILYQTLLSHSIISNNNAHIALYIQDLINYVSQPAFIVNAIKLIYHS